MANDINSMNLSVVIRWSGSGIVGGLFPQTQESQQKVCRDIAGESNIFADWPLPVRGARSEGSLLRCVTRPAIRTRRAGTENINIIWDLPSKQMLDGNKELKEFTDASQVR